MADQMDKFRAIRIAAAIFLLAGGAIHLQLHLDNYGTAAIARTFVLNAAASAVVAAYLMLKRDRLGPLAGVAVSLLSLGGLAMTRVGDGVLGFRETGLNPTPQAPVTVGVELVAVVLLLILLTGDRRRRSPSVAVEAGRDRRNRPLRADGVSP